MVIAAVLLAGLLAAAERTLELRGRIEPAPESAILTLHGAHTPFMAAGRADSKGRFRFPELEPGAYTLVVLVPGHGEIRQTVEVSPSLADPEGRVEVTVPFRASPPSASEAAERGHTVSVNQLRISERALREYQKALDRLSRNDVKAAVRHLERAVELSPQFAAAWNHLGTIAYQSGRHGEAEKHFRKALEAEPEAFSPLVNLGGVLLNLGRPQEALPYNLRAVRERPEDALAQSQLGLTYYLLRDDEKALKHLETAKRLDPSHFSRPQVFLAEIYSRRSDRARAIRELEDCLARHPDAPDAGQIKRQLERLKQP